MDDLFLVYVKAALLVIISFALFIAITAAARHAHVATVRFVFTWCRTVPARLRSLYDQEFRRKRERGVADAARFYEYELLSVCVQGAQTEVMSTRLQAGEVIAAYFATLTDEHLSSLARGINLFLCANNAPTAEIEEFLREERERICTSPILAETNLARLMARFVTYMPRRHG